ncbi:unnamed protein product [Heligmosomoides polygyrus]|uniref:CX domain-containing protein n=1 Tax=Heligmosomoides polygyrus TaxID=6339 RepID=A0A183F6Q2_HELPZ|nr:unnamed protein product [Heligmosomoides polygyrus]
MPQCIPWKNSIHFSDLFGGGGYAIAAIIAIGAASFVLYLWITDGGMMGRKQKFARNDGPTKVPEEFQNVRSTDPSFRDFMQAMTAPSPSRVTDTGQLKSQGYVTAKQEISSPSLSIRSESARDVMEGDGHERTGLAVN